jgi:hypothetical protein
MVVAKLANFRRSLTPSLAIMGPFNRCNVYGYPGSARISRWNGGKPGEAEPAGSTSIWFILLCLRGLVS